MGGGSPFPLPPLATCLPLLLPQVTFQIMLTRALGVMTLTQKLRGARSTMSRASPRTAEPSVALSWCIGWATKTLLGNLRVASTVTRLWTSTCRRCCLLPSLRSCPSRPSSPSRWAEHLVHAFSICVVCALPSDTHMSCPCDQVQQGKIKHPSGSLELLKEPTDERNAFNFLRGSTLLDDTLVQVLHETMSPDGIKYCCISVDHGTKLSGYVKAEYVKAATQ